MHAQVEPAFVVSAEAVATITTFIRKGGTMQLTCRHLESTLRNIQLILRNRKIRADSSRRRNVLVGDRLLLRIKTHTLLYLQFTSHLLFLRCSLSGWSSFKRASKIVVSFQLLMRLNLPFAWKFHQLRSIIRRYHPPCLLLDGKEIGVCLRSFLKICARNVMDQVGYA